jgi:hypothetical protein
MLVRRMHYHVRFKRDRRSGGWLKRTAAACDLLFGAIEESTGIPRPWAEKILENGFMIETRYLEITGEMKLCPES